MLNSTNSDHLSFHSLRGRPVFLIRSLKTNEQMNIKGIDNGTRKYKSTVPKILNCPSISFVTYSTKTKTELSPKVPPDLSLIHAKITNSQDCYIF